MAERRHSLEDKRVMWTDQDLELMIYPLRATGPFDVVPRQGVNAQDYVDISATSTPVNTVSP